MNCSNFNRVPPFGYVLFLSILLAWSSCDNPPYSKRNYSDNYQNAQTKTPEYFRSLINKKKDSMLFLLFWSGMSEDEFFWVKDSLSRSGVLDNKGKFSIIEKDTIISFIINAGSFKIERGLLSKSENLTKIEMVWITQDDEGGLEMDRNSGLREIINDNFNKRKLKLLKRKHALSDKVFEKKYSNLPEIIYGRGETSASMVNGRILYYKKPKKYTNKCKKDGNRSIIISSSRETSWVHEEDQKWEYSLTRIYYLPTGLLQKKCDKDLNEQQEEKLNRKKHKDKIRENNDRI